MQSSKPIKSGSIEEWRIVFKPYNADKSHKRLEELFEKKIISKKEYEDGKVRFIDSPTKLEILLLEQDFRPNIIRWKAAEVLKGYKKLQDGRTFTLEEAFSTPTITKLDVVSWVQNNRFTDFSVIYEFKNNGVLLNPSIRDFEESISENIYVLQHEKKFYKMAKRIFSLAKYHDNTELLELLTPLFNGDLGRLYIVYGDIGTIENLFEIESSLPYKELEFEFDQFKGRLSNIRLSKYVHSEDAIFHDIDVLVNIRKVVTNKPRILKLLVHIKNRLLEILSYYSEEYLRKHKVFVI